MDPGDDAEDAALVAAMAKGDKSALAAIYERHSGVMLAIALKVKPHACCMVPITTRTNGSSTPMSWRKIFD